MPSLAPGDWAYHQPPVSSPLRPSNASQQAAFFNSSPPGSPTRSSPIRPSSESVNFGATRQSLFGSFNYDGSNATDEDNGNVASSPLRGFDKFSKFSHRPTRPNPVRRKREDELAARRQLFLKTVRERGDEKRFEKRSIEAQAVRSWHEEHQKYLAQKANEASGNDWAMDAFIDDALSAQQQPYDEETLPDMYLDEEAAQLEYEAMMNENTQKAPMSEWDVDDDMLLDLIRAEEKKQGDTEMS
ncbi:hypothetical protein BROUX41_001923 [Berkeleyomyces rouxiae]|uniref:uncharacterized protein n=1 Tax=Berkeleyomyces rouxiae TaxID=2035830 RepID=UPI003B77A883